MPTATRFVLSRRVREITCPLDYNDTTSAQIFEIPEGSRLIQWILNVKTAVAGGTTTIDVGIPTNGDYYLDGVSVANAGLVALTTAVIFPGQDTTTPVKIYANLGAGNTAGEVDVTLVFSYAKDTPL